MLRGPRWNSIPPYCRVPERSGKLFFEAVGHTLDILDFMLGPVVETRAFADNQAGAYATEDAIVASFRFASGI